MFLKTWYKDLIKCQNMYYIISFLNIEVLHYE